MLGARHIRNALCAALCLAALQPALATDYPVNAQAGETLWSQDDQDSGHRVVSQNFQTFLDGFDAQGADDFVVPEGETWVVSQIQVTGLYYGGSGGGKGARSENVFFYRNGGHVPGKLHGVFRRVRGEGDGAGNFVITLPQALQFEPGRYWLSVQVNMDADADKGDSMWGWKTRSTRIGSKSVWRNPGNEYGTGCKEYTPTTHCSLGGKPGPDYMFAIYGERHIP